MRQHAGGLSVGSVSCMAPWGDIVVSGTATGRPE